MTELPQLNETDDETLCRRAAEGDREAEGTLISRYLKMVRRFAGHHRGVLDYEDLVQEGCIGLLDAIGSFDPSQNAKFGTFAYTCIRNRVYRAMQEASGRQPPVVPLDEGETAPASQDPEQLVLAREQLETAMQNLEVVLTPLEKKIFFAHLGGFDYQTIASTLHISQKSVDNALQRVRRKLRQVKP